MTRTEEIKARLDGTTLDPRDWFAQRARESFIANAPADIEWLLRENTRLRKALEFYASGDWNEYYPGGVNCKNGVDMGEEACEALRDAGYIHRDELVTDEALGYAQRLAKQLLDELEPGNTTFEVLDDMLGVLTQIDNITTGFAPRTNPRDWRTHTTKGAKHMSEWTAPTPPDLVTAAREYFTARDKAALTDQGWSEDAEHKAHEGKRAARRELRRLLSIIDGGGPALSAIGEK